MAERIILVDTSILIDYYRRTDKENSLWINLIRRGYSFAVSVITKYEIYGGATSAQSVFWGAIFSNLTLLPFDEASVDTAVIINDSLKKKRKQIDLADLFIAATAVANNLPVATLNRKHFERIEMLQLMD